MDQSKKFYISLTAVAAVALSALTIAFFSRKTTSNNAVAITTTATVDQTDTSTNTSASSAPEASSQSGNSTDSKTMMGSSMTTNAMTTSMASHMYKYKNGTYTAVGSYESPAGLESIGVSLTIKDDSISGASVTPMPNDGTSSYYQQRFADGYKSLVVGRSVDSVNLDVVSGSSLTPIGFNRALAAIKAKAKA